MIVCILVNSSFSFFDFLSCRSHSPTRTLYSVISTVHLDPPYFITQTLQFPHEQTPSVVHLLYFICTYNILSLCNNHMPQRRRRRDFSIESGASQKDTLLVSSYDFFRSFCQLVFQFLFDGLVYFADLFNGYFLVF